MNDSTRIKSQWKRAGVAAVWTMFVFLNSVGCGFATGPRRIPNWAIHIKAPSVNRNARLADIEARLIEELRSDKLRSNYTPAEQIAALAVQEIKAGRGFDAAVLLSLASYRYRQQSIYAFEVSGQGLPSNVNRDTYEKLVKMEIDVFSDLDFIKELEYLSAKLEHNEKLAKMYERGRWEILMAPESEREMMNKDLFANIEAAYSLPAENLNSPRLAEVFRERLVADTTSEYLSFSSSFYLAQTPLGSFQRTALQHTDRFFWVPICRRLAQRLAVYRDYVLAGLRSQQSKERSNAAIILGLRPSDNNLAMLERAYNKETDPIARLSFEYAFLKHKKGDLKNIVNGIESCQKELPCSHAIHLSQWLPNELETKIDPDLMVRILNDYANTYLSRFFAVVILRDIAEKKTLTSDQVNALLRATTDEYETIAETATSAIQTLPQLTRKQVLKLLSKDGIPRAALYLRWATIIKPKDLRVLSPAIEKLARKEQKEKEAIITALGQIKGPKASALLRDCFVEHEDLRLHIALIMLHRGDTPHKTLIELAEADQGPASVAFKFGVKASDAAAAARELLLKGDIEQRINAIKLVGRFAREDLYPELWQLTKYSSDVYYPGDAYVRRAALGVILWNEIAKETTTKRKERFSPETGTWRNG